MERSINREKAKQITKVAICMALLCVSSYISIPIPFSPAPITAQTIIINLIAIILIPKEAFFALAGYLLIGIIGVPVFSGGQAGIGKILGPSGGYLIGYLIAAVLMSFIFQKVKRSFASCAAITMIVGIPVIYLCGLVTMRLYVGSSLWTLISASVIPFLPGDICKCIVGSYLGYILNKRLNLREN